MTDIGSPRKNHQSFLIRWEKLRESRCSRKEKGGNNREHIVVRFRHLDDQFPHLLTSATKTEINDSPSVVTYDNTNYGALAIKFTIRDVVGIWLLVRCFKEDWKKAIAITISKVWSLVYNVRSLSFSLYSSNWEKLRQALIIVKHRIFRKICGEVLIET
eukprot:snap_masked-scaffold_33-processed-gene-1.26-mRNA-1 protein AED:1.00 eAED:1.00 QI:0/0/0/0/1/1/3/0/158